MRVRVLCCFSAPQTIPSGPAPTSAGVPGTGITATTCFADGSKRTANPSAVVVQSEPATAERKPGPLGPIEDFVSVPLLGSSRPSEEPFRPNATQSAPPASASPEGFPPRPYIRDTLF